MVRNTKAVAQQTRQRIVDAAREMFSKNGVSQTSLDQIAKHAGLTRGAVYWHFKNKSELFHAIREQVFLPLIDRMDVAMPEHYDDGEPDPLACLEQFMLDTVEHLSNDKATRQTYEIMMAKCEYVGDFAVVLQQTMNNCVGILDKFTILYQEAIKLKLVAESYDPKLLADDTHLFFAGLLHFWIKDSETRLFRDRASALIKSHIQLKRLTINS